MAIKVTITVIAADAEDVADTLVSIVAAQVADGYLEGHQRNETGSYRYEVVEWS